MDMTPKIEKKLKPKISTKMCETCIHKGGDFFQDPEDKEITRVFCKARYTNVNVKEMLKWCDFFKQNIKV